MNTSMTPMTQVTRYRWVSMPLDECERLIENAVGHDAKLTITPVDPDGENAADDIRELRDCARSSAPPSIMPSRL